MVLAWSAILITACGAALGSPNPPDRRPSEPDRNSSPASRPPTPAKRPDLPRGRAIAALTGEQCRSLLVAYDVPHEVIDGESITSVDAPVRIDGPIGGVEYGAVTASPNHRIFDCRLVVALLAWAPRLRAAGIDRIVHMSTYRPGSRVARSGRPSGHSVALAIDAARFRREDGSFLVVEDVWASAVRGADPCTSIDGESTELRLLRGLICDAAESELFQILLTPHYDHAHRNHIHLEIRRDVDWTYLR